MGKRVYISHSAADQEYVERLVAHLADAGIETWHDAEPGQGLQTQAQQRIDDSAAFVIVMSPEALASESVNNDLYLANARGKSVVPVLLRGEVFPTLRNAWPLDVTGGRMPDDALVNRLRAAIGVPTPASTAAAVPSQPVAPAPAAALTSQPLSAAEVPAPPTVTMQSVSGVSEPGVPQQAPAYQAQQPPAFQPPPPPYPPPPAASYPPPPGGYPGQPASPSGYPPPTPPGTYPPPPQPPAYPPSPPGYPGGVPPTYPPPGQYPVPTPPPRRNLGLIIGIIVGVVILVAAGVGVFLYLRIASDTPRNAVNAWFTALKDQDVEKVRNLTCARYSNDFNEVDLNDEEVRTVTWNITGLTESGDSAVATIDLAFTDNGTPRNETVKFSVVKEGGDWKVCGPAEE
jgi:hypothetical protein